jgi:predicted nuclease of restriction endonuclease-like (RecB) superfamily
MTRGGIALPDGYLELLGTLKLSVRDAQVRAQRTVNTQLIDLYWSIGRSILSEQEKQGWGAGVMDRLAHDLRLEFPQMTGLSRSNLFYMRAFAAAWNEDLNCPTGCWTIAMGPHYGPP